MRRARVTPYEHGLRDAAAVCTRQARAHRLAASHDYARRGVTPYNVNCNEWAHAAEMLAALLRGRAAAYRRESKRIVTPPAPRRSVGKAELRPAPTRERAVKHNNKGARPDPRGR